MRALRAQGALAPAKVEPEEESPAADDSDGSSSPVVVSDSEDDTDAKENKAAKEQAQKLAQEKKEADEKKTKEDAEQAQKLLAQEKKKNKKPSAAPPASPPAGPPASSPSGSSTPLLIEHTLPSLARIQAQLTALGVPPLATHGGMAPLDDEDDDETELAELASRLTMHQWPEPHSEPSDPVRFLALFEDQCTGILEGVDDRHSRRLFVNDTKLFTEHPVVRAYCEAHPKRQEKVLAAFEKAVRVAVRPPKVDFMD